MSGCSRRGSTNEISISARKSGIVVAEWLTPFVPMGSSPSLSACLVSKSWDANLAASLVLQTCVARITNPGTPATIGTGVASATTTGILTTLSVDDVAFGRIGIEGHLGAGATEQYGRISATWALHQCVEALAARYLVLPPVLTASANLSDAWIFPVSDFLDTAGSLRVKMAVMARDLTNATDTRCIAVYRTANTSNAPDGWTALEGGTWTTPAGGDDEWNTGVETPTTTDKALCQFGFAVRRNTAGGQIAGDFEVLPMILR